MGRYGNPDYPKLVKYGMLISLALVVLGAGGTQFGSGLPGWERTVLFDAEVLGTLGLLLSPFVFGILLPLTE